MEYLQKLAQPKKKGGLTISGHFSLEALDFSFFFFVMGMPGEEMFKFSLKWFEEDEILIQREVVLSSVVKEATETDAETVIKGLEERVKSEIEVAMKKVI